MVTVKPFFFRKTTDSAHQLRTHLSFIKSVVVSVTMSKMGV